MSDPALAALFDLLHQARGPVLLVADEQLDCAALLQLKTLPDLTVLTNRFDVAQCAHNAGIHCLFNDMNLAACNRTFALIGYRISKEKAIVHHVINQAPRHLAPQGKLVICGYKDEGAKTYIAKTEHYLGCKAAITRGERQLQLAQFIPGNLGEELDDRAYGEMQTITDIGGKPVYSKPGQYGWNKIDEGSTRLVECLQQEIALLATVPATALDLGCGYGYLSIMAAELGVQQITATDNNSAAVTSCLQNFQQRGILGDVVADDCARSIHHQFELVLCNPPFHRGFDTEKFLTDAFVASAAHHLKPTGFALFVVNQFIPLESTAAPFFKGIETVYSDKRFKVLKLSC